MSVHYPESLLAGSCLFITQNHYWQEVVCSLPRIIISKKLSVHYPESLLARSCLFITQNHYWQEVVCSLPRIIIGRKLSVHYPESLLARSCLFITQNHYWQEVVCSLPRIIIGRKLSVHYPESLLARSCLFITQNHYWQEVVCSLPIIIIGTKLSVHYPESLLAGSRLCLVLNMEMSQMCLMLAALMHTNLHLYYYQSTLFKMYYKELKFTYLYTKYTVKPWQSETFPFVSTYVAPYGKNLIQNKCICVSQLPQDHVFHSIGQQHYINMQEHCLLCEWCIRVLTFLLKLLFYGIFA